MKLYTQTVSLLLFCSLTTLGFAQQTENRIKKYFETESQNLGLKKGDLNEWIIKDEHSSKEFDITYTYVYQQHEGITIQNAIANFALTNDLTTLTGFRFQKDVANRINTVSPTINDKEAIAFAASLLGLGQNPTDITELRREQDGFVYTANSISKNEIPVQLVFAAGSNNELRLAWDLSIETIKGDHWWNITIDAITGEMLNLTDWVVSCQFDSDCHSHDHVAPAYAQEALMLPAPPPGSDQYNVLAIPTETPNHGPRTIVVNPSDPPASPYGWHDTNGSIGDEYTITRGNNVYATEDSDDNNNPGYAPDGGAALNFDFPMNLNQPGQGFWDPAITNLFYMNNIMHDVWYHYGFDEASGNFQDNNYGNGGSASDAVNADAQDGSGTNNANFSTPPDGNNPRMQMYLWGASGTALGVEITSPAGISGLYNAVEALLGPGTTTPGVSGDFVLFDDGTGDIYDACEAATNGGSINGNIAVIRRGGGCTFADKLLAAENEGAIAVIVVNNTTGSPIAMSGTDPGITIPAVMMTQNDGEDLILALEAGAVTGTVGDFGPFDHDSDLDNGIIAHEYGHGISTRLTGGASNSSCLGNDEQMGEGWSDWFGLMLTIEPGDQGGDIRGIGTYTSSEPTTGNGIRPAPYSTDWAINNYTYGSSNNPSITQPHGVGFIWATMLWDLNWALIDLYGFDSDVYNGTGGNNICMHLVMNGIKQQPCGPGMVEGRDAILQADQLLYGGEHYCTIWQVFAKRGLGYSADQGSANDRFDQTQAFDLPPSIDHTEEVTACQSYVWPLNGQTYTQSGVYTTSIAPLNGCDSVATLDLTINSSINAFVSYVDPITLTVNQPVDSYQWLSCSNGMALLPGETSNTFSPTSNGTYAVQLTQGNCTDTSVCVLVNQLSLEEASLADIVEIYPNPTNGDITIDFSGSEFSEVEINVSNALGQVIEAELFENTKTCNVSIEGAPGIYFIDINAEGRLSTKVKIVKQ